MQAQGTGRNGRLGVAVGACALLVLLAAFALAGCGGSGDNTGTGEGAQGAASTAAETTKAPTEPEPTGEYVSTGIPGKVGRVVVSGVGFTLYHFEKDKRNSGKSACYGPCTKVWAPYLTFGSPRAELHARKSLLGTIKRKDGSTQITYAGWPVYTYATDGSARLTGAGLNSFGAYWYPININGQEARTGISP